MKSDFLLTYLIVPILVRMKVISFFNQNLLQTFQIHLQIPKIKQTGRKELETLKNEVLIQRPLKLMGR